MVDWFISNDGQLGTAIYRGEVLRGLRVHIAGSAAPSVNGSLLRAAHTFVSTLSAGLVDRGLGLVLGVGDEPRGDEGLPCTFDWDILETIAVAPSSGLGWTSDRPGRFRVVASQRALHRVPDSRRRVWNDCARRPDLELQLSPPGWRMGGVIRAEQALSGDVLVAIGGGAGVEQLANLYMDEGKSVVPIRCDLGAFVGDGNGGASYLHAQALSEPTPFFELRDGAGSSTGRLSGLRIETDSGPAAVAVAEATLSLIGDLKPHRAFYVRLLRADLDEFEPVESFFRGVVDPVVIENGFTPYEVGRHRSQSAFMNVEIFESLHRAALVVADLTGVRPNCTMELGYALARRRRVIITAMQGTQLPFDSDKLPAHFWRPEQRQEEGRRAFHSWLERHIDMPPVIR